jgi:hypothetical protein
MVYDDTVKGNLWREFLVPFHAFLLSKKPQRVSMSLLVNLRKKNVTKQLLQLCKFLIAKRLEAA